MRIAREMHPDGGWVVPIGTPKTSWLTASLNRPRSRMQLQFPARFLGNEARFIFSGAAVPDSSFAAVSHPRARCVAVH